jgi:outer membrane protein assembly factor BamB
MKNTKLANKLRGLRVNRQNMIAIFSIILIAIPLLTISSSAAHTPTWQIPTYAYIVAEPNPIGVGQSVTVYMWLDCVYGAAAGKGMSPAIGTNASTADSALVGNNYRFLNYNLTIIAPNGTITTQIFPTVWDTTSSQYTKFTPTDTGNYTFIFNYPGQVYGANGNGYEKSSLINDTYLASSAIANLIVQQDPIPPAITSYPLPTEYWARPIYGENTDWYAISSNWLGSGSAPPGGANDASSYGSIYHNDAVGPLTSHIMWTRAVQFGGIVGGNQFVEGSSNPNGAGTGAQYYEGTHYAVRFNNPIIINGYLYYTEPIAWTGQTSGPTDCIDLRTGKVIWSRSDIPALSLGYIYNNWTPDNHGAMPPILFTSNFAQAYDAYTGESLFNVTGVPSGLAVMGPAGEQLRYVLANAGTANNPQFYLSQWNSSRLWQYDTNPLNGAGIPNPSLLNASNPLVFISGYPSGAVMPYSKTSINYQNSVIVNGNIPINATTLGQTGTYAVPITTYDWNISIPFLTSTPAPTVVAAKYGDLVLCRNGTLPSGFAASGSGASSGPYTYFAINLNPSRGTIGQILWRQTYNPPSGNLTAIQEPVDFKNRVFLLGYQETISLEGYSLDNGNKLWGPTESQGAFDYYQSLPGVIAYGNFYTSSFSGILYCYNDLTGKLLWTYGNGGAGNSTSGGSNIFYGYYPTIITSVANGVLYTQTWEHTIPNPIYKGSTVRGINATDGTEIWVLSGYSSESKGVVADGYMTAINGIDNRIYSIGKGTSVTTVSVPHASLTSEQSVVITGTVIDTSAGTKQDEQAAKFPNGVPVASDYSMKDWMGYVYQQKPQPTNFKGVTIQLSVIDSNGNYRHIGETTTDAMGTYSFTWKPDIPGDFTVYANFAGTNSYWQSYAEDHCNVLEAAATPAPTQQVQTGLATTADLTMYIGAAIAINVVLIAIIAILVLRKRS